jgi:hypothetical protein
MYKIKVSIDGETEFLAAAGSASKAGSAIQDAAGFAHNRASRYTMSSDYAAQQTDAAERALLDALAAGQPHDCTLQGMPIIITLERT